MALVACAPTIMRIHAVVAAASNTHHHMAMQHGGAPSDPDDCWSKCGYCDFLTHAPAIGSVDYVAPQLAFGTANPVQAGLRVTTVHEAFSQAAQPRGPPFA
jgi:hypothetical protein